MSDKQKIKIRINLPIYIFVSFYLFSTIKSFLKGFGFTSDMIWIVMGVFLYIPLVLYCIKKIRKIFWPNLILFFAILGYIFNCMSLYSDYSIYSHEVNGINALILTGCSSVFALLFVGLYFDEDSIYDAINYTAIINFALNLLRLRNLFTLSAAYLKHGYDMDFGYKELFSCIVFLSIYLRTKKKISLVMSILSLILLLLFGSRGPVLCIVTYLFLYFVVFRFKEYDTKKKIKILMLFIFFVFLAYIYYNFLASMIDFSNLPRSIRSLLNINYSDGTNESRKMIRNKVYDIINNSGFWGAGMLSDQAYLGVGRYSHNLFVEFQVTFGKIPGLIIQFLFCAIQE